MIAPLRLTLAVLLIAPALCGQTQVLSFEVASVKPAPAEFRPPSFSLDAGDSFTNTGGAFSARFRIQAFITFAYKLMLTPDQLNVLVSSLPKWAKEDIFDIDAKAAGNPTKDQMRLMMQSLLADRFQLKMHFESRETSVFELALVKPGTLGPKLRPHEQGPSCDTVPPPDYFPGRCNLMGMLPQLNGSRIAGARDVTMKYLAEALPSTGGVDRPVIDQTGLDGKFDFTVEWTPDTNPAAPQEGTSFAQALREQLGLRLQSTKAAVQTPMIDRIERPTAN